MNTGARALESNTTQNQHKLDRKTPQIGPTSLNTSVIGAKGVTRFGRAIKSPNQFWKGTVMKYIVLRFKTSYL